jgi:hypothetical protein
MVQQSLGTAQPGDQAKNRRGRHFSQQEGHNPPYGGRVGRTERRTVAFNGIHDPGITRQS